MGKQGSYGWFEGRLTGLSLRTLSPTSTAAISFWQLEHEKKIRTILMAYFSQSYDFPILCPAPALLFSKKKWQNCLLGRQDEAAYRRDVLFYPAGSQSRADRGIGKELVKWQELLHFSQTAFFYRNSDQLTISSPTTTRSYSNLVLQVFDYSQWENLSENFEVGRLVKEALFCFWKTNDELMNIYLNKEKSFYFYFHHAENIQTDRRIYDWI